MELQWRPRRRRKLPKWHFCPSLLYHLHQLPLLQLQLLLWVKTAAKESLILTSKSSDSLFFLLFCFCHLPWIEIYCKLELGVGSGGKGVISTFISNFFQLFRCGLCFGVSKPKTCVGCQWYFWKNVFNLTVQRKTCCPNSRENHRFNRALPGCPSAGSKNHAVLLQTQTQTAPYRPSVLVLRFSK